MGLIDDVLAVLRAQPGLTVDEVRGALQAAGHHATRREVSAVLLASRSVAQDGGAPPRWSVVGMRPSAGASAGQPPIPPPPRTPPSVTKSAPGSEEPISSLTKGQLITRICAEVGVPDVGIGEGSTEPKAVFIAVIERLELAVDTSRSKPELGEAIARLARLPWDSTMDARASKSGGGDTVTAAGLRQLLRAVWLLKEGAQPFVRGDEGERPGSTSIDQEGAAEVCGPSPGRPRGVEEAFGLPKLGPPGGGTGLGSGGEGPLHKAIKEYVKEHSYDAIGEELTYLAEDLGDPSSQALGDEIKFVTGDRVDLLMKDADGRFVVIEVEPHIGPRDHIGFHQAAKYWVLVAVANGLRIEEVRRLAIAATIDRGLRDYYDTKYGIESFEVTVPSDMLARYEEMARMSALARARASSETPLPPQAAPAPGSARSRAVIGRSLVQVPDGLIEFRHRGVTHHAAVEAHQIVLADGRRFDAPTAAARALNGDSSINGWRAWVRDGRTIAEIVDECGELSD